MKNENNIKNNRKKYITISILISAVLIGVFCVIYFFFINNNKSIKSGTIEKMNLSKVNTEAEAAIIIQNNIVKIVNKTGNKEIVGTGFFHETGFIITNSHIVDIEGAITILFPNGRSAKGKLVANDVVSDVAILSVDNHSALALNFANTLNLNVTDAALAIGYAFNLSGESSVTKGIISARRSISGIEYFQTDAAINSGFSGGPLINSRGELIGMNSLANDNATIGMAISSESLQNIINTLINSKKTSYITTERPTNALSKILEETGFDTEDIYDEKELLASTKPDPEPKPNPDPTIPETPKPDPEPKPNPDPTIPETPKPEPEPEPEPVIITEIPFKISKIIGGGHLLYNSSIKASVLSFSFSILNSDGAYINEDQFGIDPTQTREYTIDIIEKAVLAVTVQRIGSTESVEFRTVISKEIQGSKITQKNGQWDFPYITVSEIRSNLVEDDIYIPNNQFVLWSTIEITFKDGKGTFKSGDWSYLDP